MSRVRRLLLILFVLAGCAAPALAHEIRPAYFEVRPEAAGVRVLWKQPTQGAVALALHPALSNGWLAGPPAAEDRAGDHVTRTWRIAGAHPEALQGVRLSVVGLERSITSTVVHLTLSDGRSQDLVLTPDHPTLTFEVERPQGLAVASYFRLGVEHILTGLDHLSFVLGLLLLIGPSLRLLKAVTAFTVAHSITLALVALGLIAPRPALIEALVALSILFLALELIRQSRGGDSLTLRHPWAIAFIFGLMHGCAFAGALSEVGLPKGAVAPALLLFNLGVEAGQIAFIAAALAVGWAARRLIALPRRPELAAAAAMLPVYLIGSVSTLWVIERVVVLIH